MDFIFDQFIELNSSDGKYYVSVSNIMAVRPITVDKCVVALSPSGALVRGVDMPARVLVEKIAQIRREAKKQFLARK